MNNVLKTRERRKAENLSKISEFTLMDDTYMNAFFNEQPELVQFVLRIIMNKKSLIVKRSVVQKQLKSIQGRSITLDVDAVDDDEAEINIEMQGETGGAHPKRARFHSSMIDSNALVQNEDFTKLPETYVIFITSKDYFGKGLPLYTINRRIDELDLALFGDDEHIIYVNGEYIDDTPLGKLMHDFKCKDPNEMFYKPLADRAYTLKETEGGRDTVCRIMDEIGKDYAKEMAISIAMKLIVRGKLSFEEIAEDSDLTLEEVQELAKEVNVNA